MKFLGRLWMHEFLEILVVANIEADGRSFQELLDDEAVKSAILKRFR